MLIVNADDFGRDRVATDRALVCSRGNRISSTTGMVFMEDSERAARLARETGIPVGLHINFSEAFSGKSVPERLRASHGRVARFLRWNKHALLFYHPLLSQDFRYCFETQLAEFHRLYEKAPSHFDGHQHLHLATNVLIGRILPRGSKVRRSFTFFSGEKDPVNRAYRRLVVRMLTRRHVITDCFFSIAHHLTPERLERVIGLSRECDVELMSHPALNNEFELLLGDAFGAALSRTKLASYNELAPSF